MIRFLVNTTLKPNTQDSSKLSKDEIVTVREGNELEVHSYKMVENNHIKVAFKDVTFLGYNTWFCFFPHIQLYDKSENGKEINLSVPYFFQLENRLDPFGSCNCSSIAMVMAYYGLKAKDPNIRLPDELNSYIKSKGWSRHSPYDLQKVVQDYGFKAEFKTTRSIEDIKNAIKSGIPVVLFLYLTRFGHIIVAKGYDETKRVFYINDSYGEYFLEGYRTDFSGANVKYSYDLIEKVGCDIGSDGKLIKNSIWALFISK